MLACDLTDAASARAVHVRPSRDHQVGTRARPQTGRGEVAIRSRIRGIELQRRQVQLALAHAVPVRQAHELARRQASGEVAIRGGALGIELQRRQVQLTPLYAATPAGLRTKD